MAILGTRSTVRYITRKKRGTCCPHVQVGTLKRATTALLMWQFFVLWVTVYYLVFVFGIVFVMAASSPCDPVSEAHSEVDFFSQTL